MTKTKEYTCPVCGKPLTQAEYYKALGLWEEKQEHIKHLEADRKKLREQAQRNQQKVETERRRLREKERAFKVEQRKLQRDLAKQELKSKQAIKRQRALTEKKLKQERASIQRKLRLQRIRLEASLRKQTQVQVREGISKGVEQQKAQLKKQQIEFRKSKNKMAQLENSLRLSAEKWQEANSEIKRLKSQIEKGITPQIEGLLEEAILLAKLQELFPQDRFEHPGKGGDIIQHVIEQDKEIGKIVYECKKVKKFDRKHILQAQAARRSRDADFAILVTNAFPSKKQFYFVEKTVFVISPVSLEPITQTLRESLVRIFMLKLSNEAKSKAVQRVCEYLSSTEYSNKVNDVANQLLDLGKELRTEVTSHKRIWEKRYRIYSTLFNDITAIDHRLRSLMKGLASPKRALLPAPPKQFIEIEELHN